MWPWEHLAVGYLLYSGYVRVQHRERPTAAAAVAVAVGTQFPDLVDKPLAWVFGILPSGVSLAHSVFTAAGLSLVVVLLGRRIQRERPAVGFAVGYLSHLPADILYPVILGRRVMVEAFLWPVASVSSPVRQGLFENFAYYAFKFLAFLATERGMAFLALEGVLLGGAVLVWISDGHPGLPRLRSGPRVDPDSK